MKVCNQNRGGNGGTGGDGGGKARYSDLENKAQHAASLDF